jgi:hypothetical protein
VELLKAQKALVEVLTEDTELPVEAYRLAELTRSSQYDHPASAGSIKVEQETVKEKRTFPKGTYIIRTGQAMGRVITHAKTVPHVYRFYRPAKTRNMGDVPGFSQFPSFRSRDSGAGRAHILFIGQRGFCRI